MADLLGVAASFAQALDSGDGDAAHRLLTPEGASSLPPADLLSGYQDLADDMGGVSAIGTPMVVLEEWPGMAPGDRAMVYVPLEGDVYSEAINVTVAEVDGELLISSVEWGRP